MIRQTSERTHFDLDLDSRRGCRFYYDVGSDDLIALNEGKESIWLVALNVGAATGPNQTLCLNPGEKNSISPGYWGMMAFLEEDESGPVTAEEDEPRPLMAECLLLPRRWTFQQFPVPLAGLVTPGESPADDVAWTTQIICSNFGDGDNPMLKVAPATMVRIRFPTAPGEPESTENFDITNIANIATPTSRTGILHALHSNMGEVHSAMKILRRHPDQKDQIPSLADDYSSEVVFSFALKDHPGFVTCLGFDARFFVIYMERLEEHDLGLHQDRNGMFTGSLSFAERILKDTARNLAHLESEGFLHNDIKPRNMIFHPERGTLLIDFGLCTYANDGQPGSGTYPYIAPEIYEGVAPSPASDIYSLGVTMLYLLGKTALPESLGPGWRVKNPGPRYYRWRSEVETMRSSLRGTMGAIVKQMLGRRARTRITARQILEQLRIAEEERQGEEERRAKDKKKEKNKKRPDTGRR